MNLFKTALRNIKKSSKDYSVYFLTLIIGVAVFYMFNSVGSQSFMETITSTKKGVLSSLVIIIDLISVGVAVVLGLLMVYANNFLIKRRKKELGIYMILGMSKKKVSRILSIETLIVGVISLGIGLVLGIFGSQFLSIIVGKLFAADLSKFKFSFSINVLAKTVVYFFIIFIVVLLFNARTLSKFELIDLLNSRKKAEKKLIKNSKLSVVLWCISTAGLIFYYYQIGFRGSELEKNEFFTSIVIGIVCIFIFFFSLAGFLPEFLSKFKNKYFSKLNSFVVSQFGHNINTSAVAFSLISIMLFLAICAFSVGFSMNGYLNHKIKNSTPVDVSAFCKGKSVSDLMKESDIDLDEIIGESVELPIYYTDYITMKSSVDAVFERAKEVFFGADWDAKDYVVRLSDYNKLEEMYGRETLELNEDEYVVICNFDSLTELINEANKNGNRIEFEDVSLKSGYDCAIDECVMMEGMTASIGVMVLNDAIFDKYMDDFTFAGSIVAGNYRDFGEGEANIEKGDSIFSSVFDKEIYNDGSAMYATRTEVKDKNVGVTVSVVFIVLYIGIVFIITSAAVLALKILSDSMDSVDKYSILLRIGADEDMRKKALFSQVLLNFALPFVMGLIHSVFALKWTKGLLKSFGMIKMFDGAVIALLIMIVVYGGYFMLTYISCKKIVLARN